MRWRTYEKTINLMNLLQLDNKLLDEYVLDDRLDRDLLNAEIMRECGNMMPLYTDTTAFKYFTGIWFKSYAKIIKELIDTTEYEYNPIENYDRYEEGNVEYDNEKNTQQTRNRNPNITTETKTSAYNSDTYQPQSTTSENGSESETIHNTGNDTNTEKRNLHIHGNIGVTTTQQMIDSQRNTVQFNVYNWIVSKYSSQMFVLVS